MPTLPADRIAVLMPTWLGDAVMATPFLRALAALYPNAHIAAVARPLAAPVLAGLPYVHQTHLHDKQNPAATHRFLRTGNFDLAIALPNSFRAAWSLARARIPQRLGYARDWRSPLLTHTLSPQKRTLEQRTADHQKAAAIRQISRDLGQPVSISIGSPYQPTPAIDYYLALAHYLGAPTDSPRQMHLAITEEERSQANAALSTLDTRNPKLITLIPGANFGSSKCYPPDHFAAIATALIQKHNATILLAGSPAESPIINAIIEIASQHSALSTQNFINLPALNQNRGLPLGALKELIRRSSLVITNDTGPRHFAAAFNIPTIALFGPTDPRWAETWHPHEKILRLDVPCGPCQLKTCPIDHRCLKHLSPEMVLTAAAELLG